MTPEKKATGEPGDLKKEGRSALVQGEGEQEREQQEKERGRTRKKEQQERSYLFGEDPSIFRQLILGSILWLEAALKLVNIGDVNVRLHPC